MTAAVGAAVAAHDYFGTKTRVMIGRVLVPTVVRTIARIEKEKNEGLGVKTQSSGR
jgi:hypothetical protein